MKNTAIVSDGKFFETMKGDLDRNRIFFVAKQFDFDTVLEIRDTIIILAYTKWPDERDKRPGAKTRIVGIENLAIFEA